MRASVTTNFAGIRLHRDNPQTVGRHQKVTRRRPGNLIFLFDSILDTVYPYIPYQKRPALAGPATASINSMKRIRPGLEKRAFVVRLRRIKGQIEGIEKMIEADADCSDVLMQVVSARRALKSFSEEVLESHMQTCIENAAGQSESEGRENVRSLLTVLQRYVA